MHYFIYRRYQIRYNRYDDILHRLDIASAISDIIKSNAANEVEDRSTASGDSPAPVGSLGIPAGGVALSLEAESGLGRGVGDRPRPSS